MEARCLTFRSARTRSSRMPLRGACCVPGSFDVMSQVLRPADDLWHCVRRQWRRAGVGASVGVIETAVAEFENHYAVALPDDVRAYFVAENGTGQDMDDEYFRFWPLSEVRPVEDELDESGGVIYSDRFAYPNCFVFADHLMNSWLYAFRLTADRAQLAPVFRVTASFEPGEQMAPTFRQFMSQYAEHPGSIL
jgi:hypothetical protein